MYILTTVSTNDIEPYITVDTWAKCKKQLEQMIVETDNGRFFAQLIHKEIDDEFHTAKASMRCNKKG